MDEPLGGYDEAASDPAEVKQPIALSVGMGILVGALMFITITEPDIVRGMVSLLLESEVGTALEDVRFTHALDFYEEGDGVVVSIDYNYPLNSFYSQFEPFRGLFVAPSDFKELLAAEYERWGLKVWPPEPRPTPAW